MAATDARPIPIKNTAYRVTFPILDADGDLVTGATTPDSEVSIDGAAFADCTNEAIEIATSSGVYFLDLTAAEMNGDTIAVIVKTATAGAKTTTIVMYPNETGDIDVDVTAWLGTAAATPTVAGVPEVDLTHIGGVAQSATDLKDFADDGYDPATNKVQGVVLVDTLTTYTGNAPQTGDAFARLGAPAGASVSADIAAVKAETAAILDDTGTTGVPVRTGGIVASSFGANAIDGAALDPTAGAEIADAIWDEATSGHAAAGTYGNKLGAHIAAVGKAVIGPGSTTTAVKLSTVDGAAPSATNDFYNGRVIIFTSGALALQATDITDYDGATTTLTVTALTGAPADTVTAAIV